VIRLFVVDVNKDSTKSKKPSKDIKNGAIVYLDKVVKSHLRASLTIKVRPFKTFVFAILAECIGYVHFSVSGAPPILKYTLREELGYTIW